MSAVGENVKAGRLSIQSLRIRLALLLAGLLIFIGIWEAAALVIQNPIILSDPASLIKALVALLQNNIPLGASGVGDIYNATLSTLEMIVAGFALSLIGIPIGFAMGLWEAAESIIDPWINALYAIPMVALIPLVYFASGSLIPAWLFQANGGFLPDILIVFLMTVFTVIINTYHGVRYVSNTLAEVGKSFGATESQFIRHVILPASLPDIVAGMRLGLGRAVLGAVIAQALLSVNSLGYMMITFQEILYTPGMMAVVLIIALIGIVVLQSPKLIERRAFKWKKGERLARG